MPQFYFHLCENGERMIDREGVDLPDMDALAVAALRTARGMMSQDILQGQLPLHLTLEIADAQDVVLYRLPFADAVTIQTAPAAGRPNPGRG